MSEALRDPVLRHMLASLDDAPDTVPSESGTAAPVSAAAAERLNARLRAVVKMHTDAELSDAQFLAAVRVLVSACEMTSHLHHMFQPEQVAATRDRAVEELVAEDMTALRDRSC